MTIGPCASLVVAACAFVRADIKVPPRSLVAGVQGKVLRQLTEQERVWKRDGALVYQALVGRCHDSLREVAPLAMDDRGRRRLTVLAVQAGEFFARNAAQHVRIEADRHLRWPVC